MRIRLILMGALSLVACGSDSLPNPTETDENPCSVAAGTITLHVASLIPEELSAGCEQGSALEAFLLVPGRDSCPLKIVGNAISGCCGEVASGQNPYVDLYYREGVTLQALGMQSKVVYLPDDSDPIVELNFDGTPFDGSSYDSNNDGTPNAEEFCNGTL